MDEGRIGSADRAFVPSASSPAVSTVPASIPCVNGVRTMLLNGSVRHGTTSPRGHPADGMTAHVEHGGGAVSTIIDPRCFADGGPAWVMRYGNPESIRYTVASLLASYDYLLSGNITQREAIKRLMLMRRARAAIAMEARQGGDAKQAPSPDDSAAIAPIVPQSLSKEGASREG